MVDIGLLAKMPSAQARESRSIQMAAHQRSSFPYSLDALPCGADTFILAQCRDSGAVLAVGRWCVIGSVSEVPNAQQVVLTGGA